MEPKPIRPTVLQAGLGLGLQVSRSNGENISPLLHYQAPTHPLSGEGVFPTAPHSLCWCDESSLFCYLSSLATGLAPLQTTMFDNCPHLTRPCWGGDKKTTEILSSPFRKFKTTFFWLMEAPKSICTLLTALPKVCYICQASHYAKNQFWRAGKVTLHEMSFKSQILRAWLCFHSIIPQTRHALVHTLFAEVLVHWGKHQWKFCSRKSSLEI